MNSGGRAIIRGDMTSWLQRTMLSWQTSNDFVCNPFCVCVCAVNISIIARIAAAQPLKCANVAMLEISSLQGAVYSLQVMQRIDGGPPGSAVYSA